MGSWWLFYCIIETQKATFDRRAWLEILLEFGRKVGIGLGLV